MFKNYTTNQVILPLDFSFQLEKNDIAFAIDTLIESIPEEQFLPFYHQMGPSSYHPKLTMKMILCAYTQSMFSGRKIEANANKYTFVWKKSIDNFDKSLTEKSMFIYDELVKNEIIPEIEREFQKNYETISEFQRKKSYLSKS